MSYDGGDDFYDRERGQGKEDIPGDVKSFIKNFKRKLQSQDVFEIQNLYEIEFQKLTDKFYKASPWPSAEAVKRANIIDNDENFLVLYKELYFRHIYEKLTPSLNDRFDSFDNYVSLFNILLALNTKEPEVDIPSVWLWDIIDEFIYQFRTFHQMRSQSSSGQGVSASDVERLKACPHLWSAQTVIRYLHTMVNKGAAADSHVLFKEHMRDFSLIGLCRVMCLMNDYCGSLEILDEIDLKAFRRSHNKGVLAQASLSYYLGFSYMMLRRYSDAVEVLSDFINAYGRKRIEGKEDAVKKQITKISGLVAIAFALAPQARSMDETVMSVVREKYGEKLQRLQRSDVVAFEELFEEVCPKFVRACVPDYNGSAPEQASKLQLRLFISEVRSRMQLPELTSYLKLCTAIGADKLAKMANKDKHALVAELMSTKITSKELKHKGNKPASSGEFEVSAPVTFYIRNDVIHVAQAQERERHGDYFIGEFLKFDDLTEDVRRIGS